MTDVVSNTNISEPKGEPYIGDSDGSSAHNEAAGIGAVLPLTVAHGESVPIPLMLPRAVYPFGWSRASMRRAIFLAIFGVIFVVFLWQVQQSLQPFLIAFFLAALLDPSLRYMERRGRSRVYAILLLYLFFLIVITVIVVLVVPVALRQVEEVTHNLNSYGASFQQSANTFMHDHQRTLKFFGIRETKITDLINAKQGPVQNAIEAFLNGARSLIEGLLSKALWFVIIPIAGFFFMRDFPLLRAHLIWLFPERHHEQIDKMSREIVDVFSAYLRGLTKVCSLYALCAFVLFQALDVHYAVFLGLLAGVFYIIPYVGNLITSVSAGAIAYLMPAHIVLFFWHVPAHSAAYALVVTLSCVMLQSLIFDQFLYPRMVGASVGLNPVIILFALSAGAEMFGVPGMLLAAPVAASVQIVLTYFFPKLAQKPPAYLMAEPAPVV